MILPDPKDAVHKAWLYRILSAIYNEPELAGVLYFKGGTCAAMLGRLDRFSVDLDFDFVGAKHEIARVREMLERIFKTLGLEIKDASKQVPQYFLRYPASGAGRNTIKIDVTFPPPRANEYRAEHFREIDRVITCQTKETMFANKLVAFIERFEVREQIAGRDLYDVHHFFLKGFRYTKEVIQERREITAIVPFFSELTKFIEQHITQTIIDQDINMLLPPAQFKAIRAHLKQETLMFLRDEMERAKY